MQEVEVTIKVTSPNLVDYNTVKDQLEVYTGDTLGSNPVKQTLQQDSVNYVNEIKITAQTEV